MERNLAYVALFAAFVALLTLMPAIALPIGVPITLQTFGVMLAGVILGPWLGGLALLLYVGLGLLGLPIFSGGNGGLAALAGPTAGFLLSYPLAACVTGLLMQNLRGNVALCAFAASVVGGILLVYGFGILGLSINANIALDKAALAMAVYVPGDLLKAVLVALVTQALVRARPHVLLSRR